jgi:transcriptional regulator with XRE-family HTH domain
VSVDNQSTPDPGGRGLALGRRLRAARTTAGLDPAGLAGAAGVDPEAYRQAEGGDPGPLTYLDLLALADALTVPLAALLADPAEPVGPAPGSAGPTGPAARRGGPASLGTS